MKHLTRTATIIILLLLGSFSYAQTDSQRTASGVTITTDNEIAPNVVLIVKSGGTESQTSSDGEGKFAILVPKGNFLIFVSGENIESQTLAFDKNESVQDLRIKIKYLPKSVREEVIVVADTVEPAIDRRNEAVFNRTLFSRDDQIFQTLNAGINAGQHEGGGKSLEIRRFGFNLDHGGANGGLKVLTDDVQQNQGTQGHGQGYLGSLKSLSPELVKDVDIINGPFSAEYGDFSGLGVVHIRQRESLQDMLTARVQAGSFGSFRSFLAFSPKIKNTATFIAYEHSQTDGPFKNPLSYKRDNITGNFTYNFSEHRSLGFRVNGGRNVFTSSGQLPLDQVANGNLDRFGYIDPDNGGKVKNGTVAVYFKDENEQGRVIKIDGFISRSLFDLWSNFTFFLNDPILGDEVQQHDSRLQEGLNVQYLRPVKIGGAFGVFTAGANFHANQVNVGLYRSVGRTPFETPTKANARINNYAFYAQQSLDFFNSKLHLDFGLRYDYFNYKLEDRIDPQASGSQSDGRFQPKFGIAYRPTDKIPVGFHFNYGRGITSQDARSVVRQPENPKIAMTDFYQLGAAYNTPRFSGSFSMFLIDRSNEQVYIPDDGSIELSGPSRSYGFEAKASIKINRFLSLNGGMTDVLNAFYRGTGPREYLASAPRFTSNAALTLSDFVGFSGSLRYRHINSYALDSIDRSLRASGFDVMDLSVSKKINRQFELNFAVDNLANKRYFETQNYFESRVSPLSPSVSRIHVTPGYPITFTAGITFRFGAKD